MPFVETPVTVHRNPHHIHLVEGEPERADGTLEHGGVRQVKGETVGFQQVTGLGGLGGPLVSQVYIGPAGEAIFLVPGTLAVTAEERFCTRVNPPNDSVFLNESTRFDCRRQRVIRKTGLCCATDSGASILVKSKPQAHIVLTDVL